MGARITSRTIKLTVLSLGAVYQIPGIKNKIFGLLAKLFGIAESN